MQETEGLTDDGTARKTSISFPYRTNKPQMNGLVEFEGARNGCGLFKGDTYHVCNSVCSLYRLGNQSTNFLTAYVTRKLDGYRPTTKSASPPLPPSSHKYSRTKHRIERRVTQFHYPCDLSLATCTACKYAKNR